MSLTAPSTELEVTPVSFLSTRLARGGWRSRDFPYFVVFRETTGGLEIIAVAHGRRRPGYWRDRVE
jgi:hypothetical protein